MSVGIVSLIVRIAGVHFGNFLPESQELLTMRHRFLETALLFQEVGKVPLYDSLSIDAIGVVRLGDSESRDGGKRSFVIVEGQIYLALGGMHFADPPLHPGDFIPAVLIARIGRGQFLPNAQNGAVALQRLAPPALKMQRIAGTRQNGEIVALPLGIALRRWSRRSEKGERDLETLQGLGGLHLMCQYRPYAFMRDKELAPPFNIVRHGRQQTLEHMAGPAVMLDRQLIFV